MAAREQSQAVRLEPVGAIVLAKVRKRVLHTFKYSVMYGEAVLARLPD
jgi:hypothetical protein